MTAQEEASWIWLSGLVISKVVASMGSGGDKQGDRIEDCLWYKDVSKKNYPAPPPGGSSGIGPQ
jgi:hypothetical protein